MKESKARHFMLKDNKFDECGAKNKSNKDNLQETNERMHFLDKKIRGCNKRGRERETEKHCRSVFRTLREKCI